MLDQTLDTIAPVNEQERADELSTITKAEHDIDKQYADAQFWKNIGNILAEARETTDNSIAGTLTSSSSYL